MTCLDGTALHCIVLACVGDVAALVHPHALVDSYSGFQRILYYSTFYGTAFHIRCIVVSWPPVHTEHSSIKHSHADSQASPVLRPGSRVGRQGAMDGWQGNWMDDGETKRPRCWGNGTWCFHHAAKRQNPGEGCEMHPAIGTMRAKMPNNTINNVCAACFWDSRRIPEEEFCPCLENAKLRAKHQEQRERWRAAARAQQQPTTDRRPSPPPPFVATMLPQPQPPGPRSSSTSHLDSLASVDLSRRGACDSIGSTRSRSNQ